FVPQDRYLAWVALACGAFGWMLIRSAASREQRRSASQGLIDAASGLYNAKGLSQLGAGLLAQCRRESRPLGMVVLDFSDLPEVTDIYGREISRKVQGYVVRRMKALAGTR